MSKYIALLRGINVGGHKKVSMAELREILTKSGLQNVQTYIQSGNVVFESSENNTAILERIIHNTIQSHFEFEVPIIVKTESDLKRIFNDCPFSENKKKTSYFTMLQTIPNNKNVDEASQKIYENEEYKIIKDCIYFYCKKSYGKAKFNMNFFERKLQTKATARNYKTMVKLLNLIK